MGLAIGRAFLDSHRPRWLEQRGEGGEKKVDFFVLFCYSGHYLDLPGRFLSNSVRNRGDPDDEFLGSWWAPGLLLLEEKAAWSSSQFVRFPPMVSKPQSRIEPRWTYKRNASRQYESTSKHVQ